MSHPKMQDNENYERYHRSPVIQEQRYVDAANDEKNVRFCETRRPPQECLQAQGQHVPRAHASLNVNRYSSVSNTDTVTSAAVQPVTQTYVSQFILFMSLTLSFRSAADGNASTDTLMLPPEATER